ncbi:MAG: shikimate kinase [Lysobacteraceae bacterium]|nr:MAG: shikimate kinase [Xanthomonadaceae bacterium]
MNVVYLVGPTGAGKTAVGRRAAAMLNLDFVDIDELVQQRSGVDIPWIFDVEGEPGFRRRESETLAELSTGSNTLVATGAGIILGPSNRVLMRDTGLVVYLKTTVRRQLSRLKNDKRRPLLMAPDRRQRLEAMANIRNPLYEALADLTIVSDDDSLPAMARRVASAIKDHTKPPEQNGND